MKTLIIAVLLIVSFQIQATTYNIVMKNADSTWVRSTGTVTIDHVLHTFTANTDSCIITLTLLAPATVTKKLDDYNADMEIRESPAEIDILGEKVKCTLISIWSEFSTVSLIVIYLDDYEMELIRYKVQ